jgi:hypothetical protein
LFPARPLLGLRENVPRMRQFLSKRTKSPLQTGEYREQRAEKTAGQGPIYGGGTSM